MCQPNGDSVQRPGFNSLKCIPTHTGIVIGDSLGYQLPAALGMNFCRYCQMRRLSQLTGKWESGTCTSGFKLFVGLVLLHNVQFSRLLLENSVQVRCYVPCTNFSVLSPLSLLLFCYFFVVILFYYLTFILLIFLQSVQ